MERWRHLFQGTLTHTHSHILSNEVQRIKSSETREPVTPPVSKHFSSFFIHFLYQLYFMLGTVT